MGKRRPFIIAGSIVAAFTILGMAFSQTFTALLVFFSVFSGSISVVSAPYSALVPDVIPEDQVGKASGFLGMWGLFGSIAGGIIAGCVTYLGIAPTYVLMIIICLLCSTITCYYVPEVQSEIDQDDAYWSKFF